MSLRLVRCPYCGKRFNISGIAPGSRLKCGWCTAILTVPRLDGAEARSPMGRGTIVQIGAGIAAGLVAAVGLFFFLRSSAEEIPEPTAKVAEAPAPAPPVVDIPKIGGTITGEPAPLVSDVPKFQKRILDEFGPNFIFHFEVKPYLIALERSNEHAGSQLIRAYAEKLDTLYGGFEQEFGSRLELPRVDVWMPVIIFNSRSSFDRYFARRRNKMADSIKGIYEYENRRVVLYINEDRPFEVLLHEGIHQLVHYHTIRETQNPVVPSTYWFQEGLAAYFEGFRRRGGQIVPGHPGASDRLPILKQTLLQHGRKEFVSLQQLVGTTVDDFWEWFYKVYANDPALATRRAQLYYAESWALARFLRDRGGDYRKVLDGYLRAELAGKTRFTGPKQIMEDLVQEHLGTGLSELEDEFVAYIIALRQ